MQIELHFKLAERCLKVKSTSVNQKSCSISQVLLNIYVHWVEILNLSTQIMKWLEMQLLLTPSIIYHMHFWLEWFVCRLAVNIRRLNLLCIWNIHRSCSYILLQCKVANSYQLAAKICLVSLLVFEIPRYHPFDLVIYSNCLDILWICSLGRPAEGEHEDKV